MPSITSEDQVRRIFGSAVEGDDALAISEESLSDEDGGHRVFLLKHPWGDPTLVLEVPGDEAEARTLADVLSAVELPRKYSGIYHRESEQLEIFWTAFKVRQKHEEVAVRKFDLWWRGEKRTCRFGPASEQAKILAKSTMPLAAASHTEHRNTMSFYYFAHKVEHGNMGEPICFWIDCSGINDVDLDEYIKIINFYMTYYDRETPRILIHESVPTAASSTRPRYVDGTFPKEMVASDIDTSVASFWLGAFETRDPAMKYLLHYRMLEFLSMAYVKSEQRTQLINILRRPHLISSTEGAAAEIASLFSAQVRETDRLKSFIDETVRPEKVWAVLEMNKAEFSKESKFDGGFVVKAVVNENSTLDAWSKSGPISLVDRLRAIRNCLAHGQDVGTRGVVHATQNNKIVLAPWVNLIETYAAEAMLYARRTYVPGDTQ